MAFKPTEEQRAAIEAEGNVLVSAAAGSGKTAVLVERVIKRLTDEEKPVSADRLLIVTFTNAAAAEMRARIEKRLDDECRKNPDSITLLRQRQLLCNAKICTIDSFCIDLVRECFERVGVMPDFKIGDAAALCAVDEAVLKEILEKYFEAENPVFEKLLDTVGAEYDDGNFSSLLLKMYDYSRQLAHPRDWLSALPESYREPFNADNVWYAYSVNEAVRVTDGIRSVLAEAADAAFGDEKTAEKYTPEIIEAAKAADKLYCAAKGGVWNEIYNALCDFSLPSLPRVNGLSGSEPAAAVKLAFKYCEKDTEALKKLFFAPREAVEAQNRAAEPAVSLLSEILLELDERLFEEYRERGTFTFHNTEHMALQLLTEAEENPADELLDRYDEVMVDEYQDTNDLQDTLFRILSRHGERLFAVGDVKQSIYGFRGADPANFIRRKNSAVPYTAAAPKEAKKIILGNNFRCRPQACDFINFFFEHMMTEETGGLCYNEEEKLIPAAVYPEAALPPVEFDIISFKGNSEQRLKAEAERIAELIRAAIAGAPSVRGENGELRKAVYSDFAVLLRSPGKKAPVIAEVLRNRGIPVSYAGTDFAEATEITTFISLLKLIDNPESDIELLTVLMSPIFGFNAEETARLRTGHRRGSLYSALIFAAENGNAHAAEVIAALEKYRLLSVTLPVSRLIMRLLAETDYLNTVSAERDGERRRNNLLLLADYAARYEADGTATVGGFVRYIVRQSEGALKAAASTAGDGVRIMSIHASKGLQFPVCIVADMSAEFNASDLRESTLYSFDGGIGFKYFDEATRTQLTTVGREMTADKMRKTSAAEELRLLYVAMTRTQDRLVMLCSVNDAEKTTAEMRTALLLCGGRPDRLMPRLRSYAKWLLATVLIHPNGKALRGSGTSLVPAETKSKIEINIIYPTEAAEISEAETVKVPTDNALIDAVKESISYKYPYEPLTVTAAKSSVSAIANRAESDKYAFSSRPAFMSNGGITATERGTAIHRVMELIDFNNADDLESELERLYEWQYISEREFEAVPRADLSKFFKSELFTRISNSPRVSREMRFLTEIPANELVTEPAECFENEKIIIQGAVDLCFEEDGGINVLDFKTDRVDGPTALCEAYGEQLKLYAVACERVFGLPVKKTVIYSFALGKEIVL